MKLPLAEQAIIEAEKLRDYLLSPIHPDGIEVELVTACGKTEAVLTLTEHDVRPVDQNDLIAVRPLSHTV